MTVKGGKPRLPNSGGADVSKDEDIISIHHLHEQPT